MPHRALGVLKNLKKRITPYKAIILVVFTLLIFLSTHGTFDGSTQNGIDKTTEESIKIFALSKSINAGISVLQSSQVKIPFLASLQVGEALDPINDAVERLSSAIVWAIGSLFLQDLLFEVASHNVFKWAFLAIGLITISVFLSDRYSDWIVQVFILTTIFRFFIPVFVFISCLSSQMLGTKIDEHTKNLSLLSQQVPIDNTMSSLDDQRLGEQKVLKESELGKLKKSWASYKQESIKLDRRIQRLNETAGWRGWIPEFLGGMPSGKELISSKGKREKIGQKMAETQERIYATENDIECIKRRLTGKNCDSWLGKLSTTSNAIYRWLTRHGDITEISHKANEMATSITKLLIAIVIKNIVLPLVFLMIIVKCSLSVARRFFSGFKRDFREFRGYLERGDS